MNPNVKLRTADSCKSVGLLTPIKAEIVMNVINLKKYSYLLISLSILLLSFYSFKAFT